MGGSSNRQGGLLTEINVTPLVDVVLVLLVIMMVTATAVANKSIAIELPKARSGTAADGKKAPLVVSIDEGGVLYLDERRATDLEVRSRAREARASDPQATAVLAADGRTRHEAVVRALDLLRSEQVAKIAIVVKGDGEGRP